MSTLHYIGFTNQEFTVMLSAIKVETLTCFLTEGQAKLTQEEYDRGLFSLFKRGLLLRSETKDAFEIEAECRTLFSIIKESAYMVRIDCKDTEIPQYGLYGYGGNCVILSPGIREQEYVRMAAISKEEALRLIEDIETLPSDHINLNDDDIFGLLPFVHEEWNQMIDEKLEPDDPLLYKHQAVSLRLMQLDNRTGIVMAALYLLREPLQNKLVWITLDDQAEVEPYSKKGIVSRMMQMME